MKFIKKFDVSRKNIESSLTIAVNGDDTLVTIRLPNDFIIDTIGLIEGGFGCITSKRTSNAKSPYTQGKYHISTTDLPEGYRLDAYKYRIIGKHKSEDEWVYMFDDMKMLNHK